MPSACPSGRHRRGEPPGSSGGFAAITSLGWLFVVPALAFYAMFVLQPLVLSFQYSFYDWNGVGVATWVGLENYATVFTDEELLNSIFNAFKLIIFFSFIPVSLGLVTASFIRGAARGRFGTVSRTVLFLPQIIPLVAAGIMWNWVLAKSGTVNQLLTAIGLGGITRAWLGDFDWALVAVGFIGVWVLLGLTTLLLLAGCLEDRPGALRGRAHRRRERVPGVPHDHRARASGTSSRSPSR